MLEQFLFQKAELCILSRGAFPQGTRVGQGQQQAWHTHNGEPVLLAGTGWTWGHLGLCQR